jgi:DinB superfamily
MPRTQQLSSKERHASLLGHLLELLTGSNAHADFEDAIKDLPVDLRGKRPKGADHSPWEIVEHLRIAQWDILDFSRNPQYKERPWPSGYWPSSPNPPDEKAWDKSVRAFRKDLKTFCALISDPATDLYAKIPHGNGQTILREALLIADHNAHHVGQLIVVRKLLGAWK